MITEYLQTTQFMFTNIYSKDITLSPKTKLVGHAACTMAIYSAGPILTSLSLDQGWARQQCFQQNKAVKNWSMEEASEKSK